MTQERSRLPGSTPGATSPRENSDVRVGWTAARANALSLTLRPTAPPVALGLAVATLLILAESLLVYLLKEAAPGNVFGVVFVLGVLVVSSLWGFWLGAMTSLASAAVYAYFHHLQTGVSIISASTQNWVAITVFGVVALLAASLAGAVRSRAAEADSRRAQCARGAPRRVAPGRDVGGARCPFVRVVWRGGRGVGPLPRGVSPRRPVSLRARRRGGAARRRPRRPRLGQDSGRRAIFTGRRERCGNGVSDWPRCPDGDV